MHSQDSSEKTIIQKLDLDGYIEIMCSNPDVGYRERMYDVHKDAFVDTAPGAGSHSPAA